MLFRSKDFTNFFGTSVAVVPDDMKSEQERQQTPKKKGLFGFGYATAVSYTHLGSAPWQSRA